MTRNKAIGFLKAAAVAAAAAAVTGCPSPITRDVLLQAKDGVKPIVAINSPAEGSTCANIVEVRGTATDASSDAGDAGKVRSLSYSVGGSTVSGDAEIGADGAFVFQFSTVTLGNNFELSVTAIDWNGNAATTSLNLRKTAGNAVPSFAVVPGNHQVTLSWDAVPHTASYTLRYTTNGALPSQGVGQEIGNVTSPLVLPNLRNGNMHVFRLSAMPETGWPGSDSDYVRAIPLSPQSLAPTVSGEYGQIRVEWSPIPGTKEFEVWRSAEENGTYYNLSGPVEGISYVDTAVPGGNWYWYKVRPTLAGSALSYANAAQTDPFLNGYHPSVCGTCPTTNAFDVAVSGSFAYVADYTAGVRVIDLSNPSAPVLRGTCATPEAEGVAVGFPYVYVADGAYGFCVIDVSDPSAPVRRYASNTAGAGSVAVDGSFAYVTYYGEGLRVYDISNPLNPVLKGTCTDATEALGVAVAYPFAYVARGSSGLSAIDVSNPQTPTLRGTYVGTDAVMDVAVSGSYACEVEQNSPSFSGLLRVIDVSDPTFPSGCEKCVCYLAVGAWGVAVRGMTAFVADYNMGLYVVDFSSLAPTLTIKAACNTSYAKAVAIDGSHAFVANGMNKGSPGLSVIDLSCPGTPRKVGSTLSQVYSATVRGSYAYSTHLVGSSNFQVFDVFNPASPSPMGSCDMTPNATVVSGPYAYALGSSLKVIDVSSPASPAITGSCGGTNSPGFAVSGSYAYAADYNAGLCVIDISDPASPFLAASYAMLHASGTAVSGSHAYIAGDASLYVIDISDPLSPELKGVYAYPDPSPGVHVRLRTVAVNGSFVYALDFGSTMTMYAIDVSDPSSPAPIGKYAFPSNPYDMKIRGVYAYVADGSSGLYVLDVSTPASPQLLGVCGTGGQARGVDVSGYYAYVADAASGLCVIDLHP
jgi:hypothetical protein